MLNRIKIWLQDGLLRGVLRSSSYLFSANTIAIGLSTMQGILAARLLGLEQFGILTGAIMPLASNINRFVSFRMSEVVVRYCGNLLADGKRDQAAAAVKAAALTETVSTLLAYGLLALLTPWASVAFAKDPATAPLFLLYGLVLLANLMYETSLGLMQSGKRFDRIALVNLGQSVITASLIAWAYFTHGGVIDVLRAYLLGKSFAGVMMMALGWRQAGKVLGPGWWRTPFSALPAPLSLLRFAVSTNLQGTVNLFARDSETILISWLRSPAEAGYFKIALSVINLVVLPIDPFITPTYAEITRSIAERQLAATRRLLKRISMLAASWVGLAIVGLALTGWWLIPLVYKPEYAPAYPALLILLAGYGMAGIFQWNRPLLLALGHPGYPLRVSAAVGVVKTALTFALVPLLGYLAEAALMAGYLIVSIGIIVRRGLALLNQQSKTNNPQ